jgi:hypothetical protein
MQRNNLKKTWILVLLLFQLGKNLLLLLLRLLGKNLGGRDCFTVSGRSDKGCDARTSSD